MDHLRRLGNGISIPVDENRFTGRECPEPGCEGYFKIEFGTGLEGEQIPCHCPYCGHSAGQDQFMTKEQIEYVRSVAMREFTDAILKDLKKLEFDHKPEGAFGIGISMKVSPGPQLPIHYYREKQLETEVVCTNCTLHTTILGIWRLRLLPRLWPAQLDPDPRQKSRSRRKDVGDGNRDGENPC